MISFILIKINNHFRLYKFTLQTDTPFTCFYFHACALATMLWADFLLAQFIGGPCTFLTDGTLLDCFLDSNLTFWVEFIVIYCETVSFPFC